MAYLDRVTPVVDQTISRLASQNFLVDPIAGERAVLGMVEIWSGAISDIVKLPGYAARSIG